MILSIAFCGLTPELSKAIQMPSARSGEARNHLSRQGEGEVKNISINQQVMDVGIYLFLLRLLK